MERSGRTATFEEAKAKFSASWEAWKICRARVKNDACQRRVYSRHASSKGVE
jgi:hypothetical protein